jgi:bifunctional NMN adenylyltransferase/nudix hydrolase
MNINKELMMNETAKYDLVVFIGRFQVFHNSHKKILEYASQHSKNILMLIGSSLTPRTIHNPFTYEERKFMIKESTKDINSKITFSPIKDYPYNDNKWLQKIQEAINFAVKDIKNPKIAIIGHKKDSSSYYLDLFPNMKLIKVPFFSKISATHIRNAFYRNELDVIQHIPVEVKKYLKMFMKLEEYSYLVSEYNYNLKYKELWKNVPYPVTFVTTDVIFLCSGHILMGKRKLNPGKGLLALPGGFIGQNEYIIDSAIRELKEETNIKVNVKVLKASVKKTKVFDKPDRSTRGRTITHAFFIEYNSNTFPKIKAGDDLEEVFWIPLNQIKIMTEDIFEDHAHIIDNFINVLD